MSEHNHSVPSYMEGKVVAIFGFEHEGLNQALMLRNNGVKVVVALRQGSSDHAWKDAGFNIISIYDAADEADIFQVW